jgi:membrane-associated phospholipid phosphatase
LSDFGGMYEVFTVAGIGAYGLISRNKLVITTLLASQAYITGGTIMTLLKFLTGRTRPSYYPAGVEAEPRFLRPFHRKLKDANGTFENSSFPSGHATVAFAVATVFAIEYKDKPWVPIISYTTASLIGASRITENKHWITHVIVGAALGYVTGKLVDKNYNNFAKTKSGNRQKNTVSFHLKYNFNHLEPGLVYTFRSWLCFICKDG